MHSPNTSQPDIAARVLDSTLSAVRTKRTNRYASRFGIATAVVVIACAIPFISDPGTHLPQNTGDSTSVSRSGFSSPLIEHVSTQPLNLIERVPEQSPSLIQRVTHTSDVRSRFPSVSDDQLLASLPTDQVAGLVRNPDGTVTLVQIK